MNLQVRKLYVDLRVGATVRLLCYKGKTPITVYKMFIAIATVNSSFIRLKGLTN